jgi:hypothetical protein
MARKILIVDDVFKIDENTAALGGGLIDQEFDMNELKESIGSLLLVSDENNNFQKKIKIIGLQVNYSLAGFKNIFILIEKKDLININKGDIISLN